MVWLRSRRKKRRKGRSTRQIEKMEENEAVSDKKKLQRGGFALALAIIKMVVLEGLPLRCRRGCRMKKGRVSTVGGISSTTRMME
ncbi:hypothetical protein Peur_050492 [Populus x canadensis]